MHHYVFRINGHSTETALVRVKNDIMDLSAVLDTVDYNVLFVD